MHLVVAQPSLDVDPCVSCKALHGATCCEYKGPAEGPPFPRSYSEASRISKYTRQDIEDAVDVQFVSVETVKWWEDFAPEYARLIVDGIGLFLPRTDNNCVYLGPNGCTISRVKPNTCATYPFSRGERGWEIGKLVQAEAHCFGQDVSEGVLTKALTVFGETVAHLDAIARRADRDVQVHVAQMRRRRRTWKQVEKT